MSVILQEHKADSDTSWKSEHSIDSDVELVHKAEHEYSDNSHTVLECVHHKQLSSCEEVLEQVRDHYHNVKHHALKKLCFSKKWLNADEVKQQNLEVNTVETLKELHFCAEQSSMILDSLIRSN